MNKLAKKTIALGLCAALGVGGVCAAFAQTESTETTTDEAQTTTQSSDSQQDSKDETVYVLAGADGTVNKIIVSDWIANSLKSDTVTDSSELTDIENVKGDESYTIDSDGMKVWDAEGNDIYYQGNIEKELPVELTVSYKLNGETVSKDEIAGKSGKVTIRFDYENRQYETVTINGTREKIYVPFAMITGVMLSNDSFTNIEVNNGKLINDGDNTIIAGLAFPGLQENLNLSKSTLDIPDYVEITADATNFELGTTVTLATNQIFSELDETNLNSAEGKLSSVSELGTAMTQLMDGSSSLYDGLCTLLEKSGELVSGVNQLANGAKSLKDGAASLDDGAATLKKGVDDLSSGLNTLSSSSSELNDGAEQVFNSLLSTAATQIRAAGIAVSDLTIANYADVLNAVIASLDDTAVYNQALAEVTEKVEANRDAITAAVTENARKDVEKKLTAKKQQDVTETVTAEVKSGVINDVLSDYEMTREEYDAAAAAGTVPKNTSTEIDNRMSSKTETIAEEVNSRLESEEIKAAIKTATDAQMDNDEVKNAISQGVADQIEKAISENMASVEVQAKLTAASEGAKSVIALKSSLDSYNAFYLGLKKYTAGVDSAATGANELKDGAASLKDGTNSLKDGASTLYDGVLTLQNGVPALVDGTTQLRDGSMKISDGLKQFNEQGVQKLIDLINGDVDGILERFEATINVSKDYRNFAGIESDMDGSVKFIYRTDEIKAD